MNLAYYGLYFALSFLAIFRLLTHKREPSSTLSWTLFVILVPILGPLIFFIFGPQRLERNAVKRKERLHARFSQEEPPIKRSKLLDEDDTHVLKLVKEISEYEVSCDNDVQILVDPDEGLQVMQRAIREAKRFVHLEYYIIASDEVTEQLFGDLLDASRRGVEVRILYDALGSLSLKRMYFKSLIKNGVKIAGFLPLSLMPQRLNFNFRNHRKILIVDGTIAFTGSPNIGKDYFGRRTDTQWRDFSVQVKGPVCLQLEDVFAKDWQFTTQEDLFKPEYYPEPKKEGEAIVQVLESGPDTAFRTLHQALFLAINSAQHRILLTTPYFIPDSAMMTALTVAALRGVKVKLLLPNKSDSTLVRYASRSFYDPLLSAGAEIYEFKPRILHAKMLTVDNKWTILGSANMDIRSFRLNFELTLLLYGTFMAERTAGIFHDDELQSNQITMKSFSARSLGQQMLENACRVLSPIL